MDIHSSSLVAFSVEVSMASAVTSIVDGGGGQGARGTYGEERDRRPCFRQGPIQAISQVWGSAQLSTATSWI
jgi:hypothetical protein